MRTYHSHTISHPWHTVSAVHIQNVVIPVEVFSMRPQRFSHARDTSGHFLQPLIISRNAGLSDDVLVRQQMTSVFPDDIQAVIHALVMSGIHSDFDIIVGISDHFWGSCNFCEHRDGLRAGPEVGFLRPVTLVWNELLVILE